MEAVPKSDIKSVIKSDISFDISIKPTTWIGHESDYLEQVVEGSRQCKRRSSKNIEQQYDP